MKNYFGVMEADGTVTAVDSMTDPRVVAQWENPKGRIVRQQHVWPKVFVSTVFLGINHQWHPDEPPKWFETMIFGGLMSDYQTRCATRDQALEMHRHAVRVARFAPFVYAWSKLKEFFRRSR